MPRVYTVYRPAGYGMGGRIRLFNSLAIIHICSQMNVRRVFTRAPPLLVPERVSGLLTL